MAETARELAEVMVPHLADHAPVDLLQPVTRGEELAPALAGPVVRLGASSVGAQQPGPPHPHGEPVDFAPDSPQARCLSEGRPVLEPVLPDWLSTEGHQGAHAPDLGVHSVWRIWRSPPR
ncbi:hypothetical protein AB0N07_39335 [Streptomyces sp. NPDC051172]|uniref:hypothetical protein n=1 Tax=Streptomyces sp. NPDC051172 TaxID=3155796 RepID=UPI00341D3C35